MNRYVSMLKTIVFGFALLGLIAVSSRAAYGQAISGALVGTVVDSSGAAVAGASVSATNIATGAVTTTTTGGTGAYHLENFPVGSYRIAVAASGFRPVAQQVDIILNQTGTLNVTLTPGATSETIEVSGTAAVIDTTTAQLQSTYNDRLSQDLGIASAGGTGAGVLNLSLLSPGVTQSSAMGAGSGPSVGGQRPYNNNFTVEGVDNNNKGVTGYLIVVPNDAVESFTLLQNQFSAEFGHSSGGQFNTVIKSGTNSFHGMLYEYFRNRNLNAVDNFYALQGLTSNPRFDSNRYGATFGGPIIKNKLFFFTNFERQPIGLTGTSGGAVQAPTAAGLTAISGDPNLSATNFGVFKQFVPVGAAPSGCLPYSGAAANGTCPAGSVELGAASISAPAFENFENFVQSVDYNITGRDQLRARYVYNKLDEIDTQAALSSFYTGQPFRWNLLNVSEYHTFSPTIVNEFRVGFNRYTNTVSDGGFKFPGLDAFPNITFNDLGSGLNVGPDPNAPQFTIQNLYQAVDNVSWNRGNHSFKFGVEGRVYIAPQQFTQRKRGDYIYNTTQFFLEDLSPDNFGERSTGAVTYYGNQSALYWFANDSWRVRPHLTLNLGVRYEYTTVPQSEGRQALNALSNTPSITVAAINEPLLFSAPRAPKNSWAPRLGIAYSPGNSGTTSIRAGFGMAYDVLYDNIGSLAVPPQVGSTIDVPSVVKLTPNFFAGGALPGGGSGISKLDEVTARAQTSNWIPPDTKWPYSINWNLGIQHSFGKDFTAEVRYVGTRGIHLDVQDRVNVRALVDSTHFLPTFRQAPSQATLDALPNTLGALSSGDNFVPAFENAGFQSNIVADLPIGESVYHGLQSSLQRRFSNGLTFSAAYTWSRTIDNSTADFHSTDLTPRRPQDFQDWAPERSVSALSRTHRFTLAAVYELKPFAGSNWLMKNVVGNWSFSPVYTYESPQYATVQSTTDSNLNGDAAGDRAILNPSGIAGTGSGVINLCNSSLPAGNLCNGDPNPNFDPSPFVVGYLATNPNARYILAGPGALANSGRNTLATQPTNNLDLSVFKDFAITERMKFRFGAEFNNVINHAQLIPGSNPGQGLGVSDVTAFDTVGSSYQSYLTPGDPHFNNPRSVFASNSRSIALVAKFTF
jgi:Carboxypeptidase regulatory-like domain